MFRYTQRCSSCSASFTPFSRTTTPLASHGRQLQDEHDSLVGEIQALRFLYISEKRRLAVIQSYRERTKYEPFLREVGSRDFMWVDPEEMKRESRLFLDDDGEEEEEEVEVEEEEEEDDQKGNDDFARASELEDTAIPQPNTPRSAPGYPSSSFSPRPPPQNPLRNHPQSQSQLVNTTVTVPDPTKKRLPPLPPVQDTGAPPPPLPRIPAPSSLPLPIRRATPTIPYRDGRREEDEGSQRSAHVKKDSVANVLEEQMERKVMDYAVVEQWNREDV